MERETGEVERAIRSICKFDAEWGKERRKEKNMWMETS